MPSTSTRRVKFARAGSRDVAFLTRGVSAIAMATTGAPSGSVASGESARKHGISERRFASDTSSCRSTLAERLSRRGFELSHDSRRRGVLKRLIVSYSQFVPGNTESQLSARELFQPRDVPRKARAGELFSYLFSGFDLRNHAGRGTLFSSVDSSHSLESLHRDRLSAERQPPSSVVIPEPVCRRSLSVRPKR